jgi:hypothetical protein
VRSFFTRSARSFFRSFRRSSLLRHSLLITGFCAVVLLGSPVLG